MEAAIQINDLRIDYGRHEAVRGISLEVPLGAICGLVGPNGAGKSSTFRVLATLQEPTYGHVRLCGLDTAAHTQEVRRRLGYMPDLAPVPSDLRVWEFLDLFAAAHGLEGAARRERPAECLASVELTAQRDAVCNTLSRGQTQRLVLAKELIHRPQVLILDEPASGMDPHSRIHLREALRGLAREGAAVIVSSHILTELAEMCSHLAVMAQGQILASGTVAAVRARMTGGQRQLVLRIASSSEAAAALLATLPGVAGPPICTPHNEGGTEILFPFAGTVPDQAPLITALAAAGVAVAGLEERTASFEDILVRLSQQQHAGCLPAPQ